MPEPRRYEAERAAWIKAQRWPAPLRAGAARRAEQLARRARRLDRAAAGLGEAAIHEAETPSSLTRWTRHDDAGTSALGFVVWCIIHVVVGPLYFGVAWAIAWLSHQAWELVADRHRVRVLPYLLAAALVAVAALVGRPLGWDLWAIHGLAQLIEQVTGGWIAPRVLSGWYAAGWISWLEIQLVLGLLGGAWLAYVWGWTAPAVRRGERAAATRQLGARTPDRDPGIKIIGGAVAAQNEGADQ